MENLAGDGQTYAGSFSVPAASTYARQKLVIEWAIENYKTESWGWSDTWFNFDNISVIQTLK